MIALLLAQLVMPSPSVEPLSPPGMVCMGECSDGPMVWRASPARGRLVVACDLRSDTCSDGRQIATTRSTPVPCETSPGVWEIIPADQGCYSVRGLESWAATTSYLSYGAELDRSPWVASSSGASLEPLSDGWRINKAEGGLAGWRQNVSGMAGDTYTSTCIVRGNAPGTRLYVGTGTFCSFDIISEDWTQVSCTRSVDSNHFLGVYPCGNSDPECSVDVRACWYGRSPTPGRACWGGEAPVTCAADRHTISTEGWPTTEGEISVTVTVGDTDSTPVIIDGRATSGDVGPMLYVTGAATNSIGWRSDSVTLTAPNVIERHKTHRIVAGRRDGRLYLVVDGVRHEGPEAPPLDWQGVAILGRGRVTTFQGLNGSISSLRVRSFE